MSNDKTPKCPECGEPMERKTNIPKLDDYGLTSGWRCPIENCSTVLVGDVGDGQRPFVPRGWSMP